MQRPSAFHDGFDNQKRDVSDPGADITGDHDINDDESDKFNLVVAVNEHDNLDRVDPLMSGTL